MLGTWLKRHVSFLACTASSFPPTLSYLLSLWSAYVWSSLRSRPHASLPLSFPLAPTIRLRSHMHTPQPHWSPCQAFTSISWFIPYSSILFVFCSSNKLSLLFWLVISSLIQNLACCSYLNCILKFTSRLLLCYSFSWWPCRLFNYTLHNRDKFSFPVEKSLYRIYHIFQLFHQVQQADASYKWQKRLIKTNLTTTVYIYRNIRIWSATVL